MLNLEPQPGETDGFSPEEHVTVLQAHLGGLPLHSVIADADPWSTAVGSCLLCVPAVPSSSWRR